MRHRRKLAPSIWQDEHGISIVVRVGDDYREPRYPLGTDLKFLKDERDALRVEMRKGRGTVRRGSTLADDVPVYLKARAAMPTIRERELQLSRWVALFGTRRTLTLQSHEIQTQRDAWLNEGKSPAWVNHQLRALSNLFRVLYPDEPNPVRRVAEPAEPAPAPRAIPAAVVAAIFKAMPDTMTKARLQVLAATGLEQSMLARITPADVDLKAATVRVPRRRKGRGVEARVLPLSVAGVAAFKKLGSFGAFGAFSTSSVYKSFHVACRHVEEAHAKAHPKQPALDLSDLRPKDLRHTFGTAVSLATAGNVATIQHMLVQTTPAMAERYRMAAVPVHLREAADALSRLEETVGRKKKSRKTR